MSRTPLAAPAIILALALLSGCGGGEDLLLGATTSLQGTGLLDELVAGFEEESGLEVKYAVAGSGQVLELLRRGEVDVAITHSPEAEAELVAAGDGVDRRPVMENEFLLAGPRGDPAGVTGSKSVAEAFGRIAAAGHAFVSRGDTSGTHIREVAIWRQAGIDLEGAVWYQESATTQSQNLLVASDKAAYTLVDSSTFRVMKDRVDLVSYLADSEPNLYSVIRANPERHAGVKADAARAFSDFLLSERAREIINAFGRDQYGESLFSSLAVPSERVAP